MEQQFNIADMKNLCLYPWYHLSNDADGKVRPCCIFKDNIKDADGNPYYMQKSSVKEIYSSDYMKKLRQKFIDGERPKECSTCWDNEEIGMVSSRQRYYDELPEMDIHTTILEEVEYPIDFQLILNNSCNLKCRICSPHLSSTWHKEVLTYTDEENLISVRKNYIPTLPHKQLSSQGSYFIENIEEWGPYVRKFNCLGGEPLYSKAWYDLINRFIKKGWSKNVNLSIVTNCTFYDEEFINKLIANFKKVSFSLSIDGIEEAFEYVRSNAKWEEVKYNFYKFRELWREEKILMSVSMAVNWMCLLQIPKFIQFINEGNTDDKKVFIWFSKVYEPLFLNPRFLPDSLKNKLPELFKDVDEKYKLELEGLVKYVNTDIIHEAAIPSLFEEHFLYDRKRNTSFWNTLTAIDIELKEEVEKIYKSITNE